MSLPQVLTQAAFGLAFGLMGRTLQRGQKPDTLNDEKPSTTARRGDYLPLLIGREKVGAKLAAFGNRFTFQEAQPGQGGKGIGQGGAANTNIVYVESGWHQLAIGPCTALNGIYQDGELWYSPTTPLNPLTHPSGTTITIDSNNVFRIYWGEADQPIDAGVSELTGVGSRWKFCFYIYWVRKRLGGFPNWPVLEYDIESRPYNAGQLYNSGAAYDYDALTPHLSSGGDAWLENGPDETNITSYEIIDFVNSVGAVATHINIADSGGPVDLTGDFPAGQLVRIQGNNPLDDGDYVILGSSYNPAASIFASSFELSRDVRGKMSDWTQSSTVTVTSTQAPGSPSPPGVALTGNTWLSTFQVTLGGSSFLASDTPSLSTGAVPNGAANALQLGTDINAVNVFFQASSLTGGTNQRWRIYLEGTPTQRHGVEVEVNKTTGFTSVVSVIGSPITQGVEDLNGDWSRVAFRYQTGAHANAIAASTNAKLVVELVSVGGLTPGLGDGAKLVTSTDASGNARATWTNVGQVLLTGVTTIEFGFDFINPQDEEGTIGALLPGPGGARGANGAHILNQLLHESYPHGSGLPTVTGRRSTNLASLQAAAIALDEGTGEGLRSHLFSNESTKYNDLAASLCLELGIAFGWDITQDFSSDGAIHTTLIRSGAVVYNLQDGHLLPAPPEVRRVLEAGAHDHVAYLFRNGALNFKDDGVSIYDDGRSVSEGRSSRNTERLISVRDYYAAQSIATRRSQEDLSPPTAYTAKCQKDSDRLRPGDVISMPPSAGLNAPLRVLAVQDPANDPEVKISVMVDTYSSAVPVLFPGSGSGPTESTGNPNIDRSVSFDDAQQAAREVSPFLADRLSFFFLRVRENKSQGAAAIYISADGTTYEPTNRGAKSLYGGTTITPFSSTYSEIDVTGTGDSTKRSMSIEYGPVFNSPTDDPDEIPILDEKNWKAGRLVAFINTEMLYVREVVSIGNNVYQLRGVLRGRLDSSIASHPVGSEIYIAHVDDLIPRFDVLPAKGESSYFKFSVSVGTQFQSLASAPAHMLTIAGRTILPMAPLNVRRVDTMSPSFLAGEDVTFRWSWKDSRGLQDRSGQGMQGYGEPVQVSNPLQGTFTVFIIDPNTSNVVRTVAGLTSAEYTYTAADRLADLTTNRDFRADVVFVGYNAEQSVRATRTFEYV